MPGSSSSQDFESLISLVACSQVGHYASFKRIMREEDEEGEEGSSAEETSEEEEFSRSSGMVAGNKEDNVVDMEE